MRCRLPITYSKVVDWELGHIQVDSVSGSVPKKNASCIVNVSGTSTKYTNVFTMLSAIKRTKSHLSSTIISEISLFDYVIILPVMNWWQCVSRENINSITK